MKMVQVEKGKKIMESSVSIESLEGSITSSTYKVIVLKFEGHSFTFRLPEFQYHKDAVNELFKLIKEEARK